MSSFSGFETAPLWCRKEGEARDVVLSSRVRLSRNLAGFTFPEKLTLKDEEEVKNIVLSAVETSNQYKDMEVLYMNDVIPVERMMLFEKRLVSRDFSEGRNKAVVIRSDKSLSCMVNETDHLKIAAYTGGLDLEEAFNEAREFDVALEKNLDYAVSLEFGYLTSQIKNAGTGMKASVMLHLPFLVRTGLLDRAIKSSLTEEFSVKGFLSDEENSLGDLYQVSNEVSIGISEEAYLKKLQTVASSLMGYERRARDQFYKSKSMELEDIFYRAYGILKNCRLLSLKEAVRYLMDFRIGIIMGWSDVPLERIDYLIILVQKAHIQSTLDFDEESNSKIINYTRSKLVKRYLELLQ